MTIAPTGSLSVPLHLMRGAFLSSTVWQGWAGTDFAARTFLVSAPADTEGAYAIIGHDMPVTRTRAGISVPRFRQAGRILVYLSSPVIDADDSADAETAFTNKLSALLEQIEGTPGQIFGERMYINESRIDAIARRDLPERDRFGDAIECEVSFTVTVQP